MFNDLFVFSKVRTRKEAFGFYIIHFIFIIILSGLGGMIAGRSAASFNEGFAAGLTIGIIIVTVYCLVLSILIVFHKKLFQFLPVFLCVVSGVLALIGGGILGLLPIAYLVTLPDSSKKSSKNA